MSRPKLNAKLSLETMETRLVPAGLFMNKGVLSFDGAVNAENYIEVQSLSNGGIKVFGNLGGEKVYQKFAPGAVTFLQFIGGNKADRFQNSTNLGSKAFGYGGRDQLLGGTNTDTFFGGDGNDWLKGDPLAASGGNDYLDGQSGEDTVQGCGGNDWCIGGTGSDQVDGGGGNDIMIGGSFNTSTRRYTQDGAADELKGGSGADIFVAEWYMANGRRTNRDSADIRVSEGDRYDNP